MANQELCSRAGIARRYVHVFFFNDTATTEIYTLSLHDALPISKYNVDDVALGVCKTGAEEAGVTEVRTSFFGTCFTDKIGRAVQQECRDRSRMPSSACKKKNKRRQIRIRSTRWRG